MRRRVWGFLRGGTPSSPLWRVWIAGAVWVMVVSGALGKEAVGVYPHRMDPRHHPDDARRAVKPPDQGTFKNTLQFIALRSIPQNNYTEPLDRYTRKDRLGDILWPAVTLIQQTNVSEIVQEIKRRDLYLFDLWGFVPGSSGPNAYCSQFALPDTLREMFERELGDRWLGMDNGEQDGRYVGGYAWQMLPTGSGRAEQYLHFQRFFERMGDLLGNRLATLVSLNFGHYFLREGIYTMIGAETAQALPNSQVYYAFIRGAGKQYGVPWFGNVSIYNRWGHKRYVASSSDPGAGPTKGTSLSLMKRLLYSHILYNCVAVGFEASLYDHTDALSPIGAIQQGAVRWSEAHGDPGVMHTPVAVMTDFLSGWSFPRHLYTPDVYKVWGNLPYAPGDYLTDGVLGMLYPGYPDASYFHDERGFMSSTPFGDIADCVLSDAPGWVLRQYPVLVVAGRLEPSAELSDTLAEYVRQGGHLVLTAVNASALFPDGIAGIRVLPEKQTCSTGQGAVTLHAMELSAGARVVCRLAWRRPAAARGVWGKGHVTVFASPNGIAEEPQCALPAKGGVDRSLDTPYPLLAHVRETLAPIFRSQMLFALSGSDEADGLSFVTCRRAPGEYTVGLFNAAWDEKPFALSALAGTVTNMTELATGTAERNAAGFLPEGIDRAVGQDAAGRIAGGAVRIFRVFTDEARGEKGVREIPLAQPPPNPRRCALALRNIDSIQREVLLRPTFFRHFDTVMVDARYLVRREKGALAAESGWLTRQGVRLVVDLSPSINLFPDLRLVNNDTNEYARSMAVIDVVMEKMQVMGSKDLVIGLHRPPETHFPAKEHYASVTETCRALARKAAAKGITLHLRQAHPRLISSIDGLAHWVRQVNEPNFKGAPALSMAAGTDPAAFVKRLSEFPCGLVLVSGRGTDVNGQTWTLHAPLSRSMPESEAAAFGTALKRTGHLLVLDACYDGGDDEYRDASLIEGRVSGYCPIP